MIPGVSETCAATILAELNGPDVKAFQSDAHLASWAGLCPDLMKVLALKNPHISRKEIDISSRL